MELRATEDIPIGVDVTPWISPLAHCLHTQFLSSHCSSCFCHLPSTDNTFPCPRAHPSCPIFYCSSDCSSADSTIHVSSGECHLISILPFDADLDATNLRLALRLAFLVEGLLPVSAMCPDRIGGLMTNRGRIRNLDRHAEELKLLSLAREAQDGDKCGVEAWFMDASLCAVLTNAVEVVLCTRKGPIGAAVYPPSFSWFNHGCAPNALFRFKLFGDCHSFGRPDFLVEPNREDNTVMKSWSEGDLRIVNELRLHGPRVIARSIRSIRKGEEVCITYIDPLLPKGIRQSELQESYLFHCGCHRCSVSPSAYVDRILQGNLSDENILWMRLNAYIQQSINKYRVDGDPEECIFSLEALLLQLFNNEQNSLVKFQEGRDQSLKYWLNKKATLIPQLGAELLNQYNKENKLFLSSFMPNTSSNNGPHNFDPNKSGDKIKNELECNGSVILHPLHYLLINSYIALASAYRVNTSQKLANGDSLESFMLRKAGTAYSLLLAGGVHFLYTLEPSLISFLVEQWVDSGTSLLELSKGSASDDLYNKPSGKAVSCDHLRRLRLSETSTSEIEFKETYEELLICIRDITAVVWPFLIEDTPCLNFTKSPMDFSCLEKPEESITQRDMKLHLLELGVHCLLIGKYLGSVCYGFDCQLVTDVQALLRVV